MCGRVTLKTPAEAISDEFDVPVVEIPPVRPRYNIAPSQDLLVVRSDAGARRAALVRWGLVPFWAPDLAAGNRMINARAETIFERPAFREAVRERRCLVVVDGFYEWRHAGRKDKQPFYFRLRDGRPIAFAGLWARWKSPEGERVETCTIVTTGANALLEPLHDRMPAILLGRDARARWLDPELCGDRASESALEPLLRPCDPEVMLGHPVSSRVNRPDEDDPGLIEAVSAAPPARAPETPRQGQFEW